MTVEEVKEQIALVTHHLTDLKKELDNYEFDEDDDYLNDLNYYLQTTVDDIEGYIEDLQSSDEDEDEDYDDYDEDEDDYEIEDDKDVRY